MDHKAEKLSQNLVGKRVTFEEVRTGEKGKNLYWGQRLLCFEKKDFWERPDRKRGNSHI